MFEPRHHPMPRRFTRAILLCFLAYLVCTNIGTAAPPGENLVRYLEGHLGLSERQAQGALGALLVFAQDRLTKTDFDELARNVPNAKQIVQDVKLQGIVTHPLDDIDEYEASLSSLGIGQPLAGQVAPAVLEYLGATGHDLERDILAGVLR
jgi:hypothetical protein